MKKKISLLLALIMLIMMLPTAFAAQTWTKAYKNYNDINLDGASVYLNSYIVDKYTYIKLRDVAAILSGKKCQFDVGYDKSLDLITITSNASYTPVEGDLMYSEGKNAKALVSKRMIIVNGGITVIKTALINRFNYVQLRDIGTLVGLGVDYDNLTKTIVLNSGMELANEGDKSNDVFNFDNKYNNIANNTIDTKEKLEMV